MKRLTKLALFSALLIAGIQSAFAEPFGIEMGMSLAEVRQACGIAPERVQDNVYEITPPKTNDMFATYYVRIDPEYGVYWMKAIGKNTYTNGYGERLISTFETLVESIRKTYGEELYRVDELHDGSMWGEPDQFMYALMKEDRELYVAWAKSNDESINAIRALTDDIRALRELLSDPNYEDRALNAMKTNDSIALKKMKSEKISQFKKLPNDISAIGVFANAVSESMGYVSLEYSFSNANAVQSKADSVF